MSFLDRIAECNAHDLSNFRPFMVAGQRVGWVRRELLPVLSALSPTFKVDDRGVTLNPALKTFEARSEAVIPAVQELERRGIVKGRRNEFYPITTGFTDKPLLQMERAAIPHFGVRAYGVHMNGFVRRKDGLHLWVARRARGKETYPGMLDNTVAGGQPIGIGLADNLVKECKEEANIPEALSRQAHAVGAITYTMEAQDGLKPDVQFCYDLELPEDFTPQNTDGEIEEFFLWPIEKVAEIVRDTREFKFNCNLVIIDFLVRRGILPPDHPDYLAIAHGLRQGGSERRLDLVPRKFIPQPSAQK
jgi:isopentenyldiphosphate isomerase